MMCISVKYKGNFTCFTAELVMCVAVFNLLDWGPSNYLAAALHSSVYLYASGEIPVELTTITGGYCSAVKWNSVGDKLIIGTNNSAIQVGILLRWMFSKLKKFSLDLSCNNDAGKLTGNAISELLI
jgi:hypothetical protein